MDISVIVGTHNRHETLAKTLDSLANSFLPDSTTWEVLVVDNNSTDGTLETAKSFCRRYPNRFRYTFEPQPGRSYALNTGIRKSLGSILAFVDDDATVESSWLQRIATRLGDSAWAGCGGPVILEWSCSRPRWLSNHRLAVAPLAGFGPAREAGETDELFGTNMAFRRTVFDKYGGFRTDLGVSANRKTPRANDDTEFVRRLLAGGERLFYEPSAIVFHPAYASRLTKAYFLAWWFDKGRADIRMLGKPREAKWFVGGIPLCLLRRLATGTVRWMLALESSKRFDNRLGVQYLIGMIVESRRLTGAAVTGDRRDSLGPAVSRESSGEIQPEGV